MSEGGPSERSSASRSQIPVEWTGARIFTRTAVRLGDNNTIERFIAAPVDVVVDFPFSDAGLGSGIGV